MGRVKRLPVLPVALVATVAAGLLVPRVDKWETPAATPENALDPLFDHCGADPD